MTKYILTLGLNDKDTKLQKFDTITSYKIVEIILKKQTDGYTIYETKGGYKHDDGTFVQETSLRIELLFMTLPQVKAIADNLKRFFNQETIAIETIKSNSELY